MSLFSMYFHLGLQHILDVRAFDHLLFLLTLCAVYRPSDWKNVLVLITAFTLGHSATLALATLDLLRVDAGLVELLIPLTILLTALANVLARKPRVGPGLQGLKYATGLFFGLIHGLGFSSYLKSLLGSGREILLPLFSFNLGIEVAQIAVVTAVLLLGFLVVDLATFPRREWHLLLSGAGLGVSLVLILERLPL